VSNTLKSIKISRKNLRREVVERSQLYRDDYIIAISRYTYEILIYLDESTANEYIA